MANKHLTDQELQAFLFDKFQEETVVSHLNECIECKCRLKEYQFLNESIQKIGFEAFSFDVQSLVMNEIYELEAKKGRNATLVLNGGLIVLTIFAIVIGYPYFKTILTTFHSQSIMTTFMLLVSGLGVVVFLVVDLYRQYKQKEMLLFQ